MTNPMKKIEMIRMILIRVRYDQASENLVIGQATEQLLSLFSEIVGECLPKEKCMREDIAQTFTDATFDYGFNQALQQFKSNLKKVTGKE